MHMYKIHSLKPARFSPPNVASHSYSIIYVQQVGVTARNIMVVMKSRGTYDQVGTVSMTFSDKKLLVGRSQLKCEGTRAEIRFRLSAKRTSPFKSAGGVSSVDYWEPRCAHQQ
jgi:hypothetical protein